MIKIPISSQTYIIWKIEFVFRLFGGWGRGVNYFDHFNAFSIKLKLDIALRC